MANKFYNRINPYPNQVIGLEPHHTVGDDYHDCEIHKPCGCVLHNPISRCLQRTEKEATEKPKIDETIVFEGLAKVRKKNNKRRPRKPIKLGELND